MLRNLGSFLLLSFSLSLASGSARATEVDDGAIVGGTAVPRGKWPDVVAVLMRDGACTGTLIAPDVVLTAGHCIDAKPVEVVIDTVDYGRAGGERIAVAWSRAYPEWWRRYDVGVLVLERPATQTPRAVTSACTSRQELVRYREVEIVGFGLATPNATDANTRLREATVAITDPTCTFDAACQEAVAPHGEFAAGGNGTDACFGDSGGPVFVKTAEGHAVMGVVSRGLALAAAPCGGGGVYVRVDKVTSWIQSVTGRTLTRTTCEGRADGDGDDDEAGCTVGAGAGLGVVMVIGGVVVRRRRRAPPSEVK